MQKYIYIFFILIFSFFLGQNEVSAHSVQVQYCINCNGDLRIWLEHWHGTENPNTTSMTISVNINGTITTQTSVPGGGVINVTPGDLPGCSSPITYVTGCSGEENTYNDWVYYDFLGLPQGVPISFTVISGNTVFTEDGCGMYPLTVNVTLDAVTVGDQNLCDGAPSTEVAMTNWTNSNPAIGLPASGAGNIPVFTPIGGPGTTATISYTSVCISGSFEYTVVPSPLPDYTVASDGIPTNTICLGSTFDFSNSSTILTPYVITDYLWDFGDGNTSTATNPSYTYAADGTFDVTLTATSDSGCVTLTTQQVIVNPFPVVSAVVPDVCAYEISTFTNTTTLTSGTITNWEWDFGDGNTSAVQNPTNQYGAYGTYNTSLIATTDIGCIDTFNLAVNVFEVPQANFSFMDVCGDVPGVFTDLSTITTEAITWSWDFGDGNTSTLQSPSNQYLAEGVYDVELIVQSISGCYDTITQQMTIYPGATAAFAVTDDCLYNNIIMTDASTVGSGSITGWDWDFGDGNTSGLQNSLNLYNTDGTYDVTLIVTTDNGCTDTLTQQSIVFPRPNVGFNTAPVCLYDAATFTDITTINAPGVIASWLWSFGDGTPIVSNQNESHLYTVAGTYDITLIVTSTNGCVDQMVQPITIYPIPVPNFTSTSICVNTPPTNFTDLSSIAFGMINLWNWNFADGNSSNLQNPSNSYIIDGDYNVQLTVTSDFGCVNDTILPVTVYEKPSVVFSPSNADSCNDLTVTFQDNSTSPTSIITSWEWDLGNGQTSTSLSPTATYGNNSNTDDEFYDIELIVMNDLGCYDTLFEQNYIVVRPTPLAGFYPDPASTNMYETGVGFVNTSVGGMYYDWDLSDNATSTDFGPFHTYSDTGTYLVTQIVTTEYGCIDSITYPVEIYPVVTIFVPNAFTPNGDGINDDFFYSGFAIVEERFNFYVFDRWGEMIYETHGFSPWDGMYKGVKAQEDVYVWRLICRDVFGKLHDFTGHVSLLR